MLNIQDSDQDHELDTVLFSPGDGVPPVLFPIKDRTQDHMWTTSLLSAHKDDPRVQAMVQESIKMKAELKAREKANHGLTYPN